MRPGAARNSPTGQVERLAMSYTMDVVVVVKRRKQTGSFYPECQDRTGNNYD